MPNRRKKIRSKPRIRRNVFASTVRVPFRDVTTVTRTTSAGYEITSFNLNIASFASTSRVRSIANNYEYYRFSQLDVKAFVNASGVAVSNGANYAFQGLSCALGFVPSGVGFYTAPTTYDELMQMPSATFGPGGRVYQLRVGSSQLYGSTPSKWYHTTTTGTPPSADSQPGSVVWMTHSLSGQSAALCSSFVAICGVVEFKAPIDNGSASMSSITRVSFGEDDVESKELRIDTSNATSYFPDPRIGGRDCSFTRQSVPNTPTSKSLREGTPSLCGDSDGRSDRQFDRPRLIRQ